MKLTPSRLRYNRNIQPLSGESEPSVTYCVTLGFCDFVIGGEGRFLICAAGRTNL